MLWLHKFAIIMAFLSSTAVSDQYIFCQLDCKVQRERIPKLVNAKIRQLSLLLLYLLCPHWEKIGNHIGLASSNIPNRNNALAVFSLYPLNYIFLLWHNWIFSPILLSVWWFSLVDFFCFVGLFWVLGLRSLFNWCDFSSLYYSSDRDGLGTCNLRLFLNDFWFLLPSHQYYLEMWRDPKMLYQSCLSFTLLLFHQVVQLVWYFILLI